MFRNSYPFLHCLNDHYSHLFLYCPYWAISYFNTIFICFIVHRISTTAPTAIAPAIETSSSTSFRSAYATAAACNHSSAVTDTFYVDPEQSGKLLVLFRIMQVTHSPFFIPHPVLFTFLLSLDFFPSSSL